MQVEGLSSPASRVSPAREQGAGNPANPLEEANSPRSISLDSEDAQRLGLPKIPGLEWKIEAVLAAGEGNPQFRERPSLESLIELSEGSSVTLSTQVAQKPNGGVTIPSPTPITPTASAKALIEAGASLKFEVIENPEGEGRLHRITVNLKGELGGEVGAGVQGPGLPRAESAKGVFEKVSGLATRAGVKVPEWAERVSQFLTAPAIKASIGADAIREGSAILTLNPASQDFGTKLKSILPHQDVETKGSNPIQTWWGQLKELESAGCLRLIERSSVSANGSATVHIPGRNKDIEIVQAKDTVGEVTQTGAAGVSQTMWRERLRRFFGETRTTRVDAAKIENSQSCALISFSSSGRKESDIVVASRFARRFEVTCEKLSERVAKGFKLPERTLRGVWSGTDRAAIDFQLHIDTEQFNAIKSNAEGDGARHAYLVESDALHEYNPKYRPLGNFPSLADLVRGKDESPQAKAAKEILDHYGEFPRVLLSFVRVGENSQRYTNITGRDLLEDLKRLRQADDFQRRFDRLKGDECGCSEGLRKVLRDFTGSIELCPFTQVAAIARLGQDSFDPKTAPAVTLPRESLVHFHLNVPGSADITIGKKVAPSTESVSA